MTKTFTLICPDELCEAEFPYEADPQTIGDGGELITCPKCGEEWEWEFDLKAETLELLPDEEEDELESSGDFDDEDFEDEGETGNDDD
jgi:hypothetical protein